MVLKFDDRSTCNHFDIKPAFGRRTTEIPYQYRQLLTSDKALPILFKKIHEQITITTD